jgi:hypothetical protein
MMRKIRTYVAMSMLLMQSILPNFLYAIEGEDTSSADITLETVVEAPTTLQAPAGDEDLHSEIDGES